MSDSQVLARKFRPQTFDQIVGQEPITRTLHNALKTDRVHHAYLFTGARGVGKTTTARILAKSLNCGVGITITPCDQCPSCIEIAASRSIDVLEIDAASNTGVDNVRDVIINSISIAPARDRHKIFIIDEVHMLSAQAFNALLKTLEEPPPRVVFILATTDQQKVPETILSRCQIFEFRTIALKKIIGQLRLIADQEQIGISDAALLAIARAGEGSMRDAESALDQVISFAGSKVADEDVSSALGLVDIETLNRTIQAIADQDSAQLVRIVDEVVSRGYDLRTFCREMMVHIRALLVVKIAGFDSELVQLPDSEADTLEQLGQHFSEQDLLRFFSILTKTEQDIRLSSQSRFQLEIGLVKLAKARRLHLLEEALGRIEALESRLGGSTGRSPLSPVSVTSPRAATRPAQYSSRTSAPPRSAASPARPSAGQSSSEKPKAPRPTESSLAETASSSIPAAAATPAPARSDVTLANSETPPLIDEPFESEDDTSVQIGPPASSRTPADRIKASLLAKRKMMIVTALDKGTVSLDGDYLRVSYPAEDSKCKGEIEARDKRIAIEDACEEVLGKRLTLRVSIAGEPDRGRRPGPKEKVKTVAEENPNLQALVNKFNGEIIEVVSGEQ